MTFGLSVMDVVHLKGTFIIGKIIGMNDWSDRYPADLHVVYSDLLGEVCQIKVRADEVKRLDRVDAELVGV